MAIELRERPDSRAFTAGAYVLRYWLLGTADADEAVAYFLAHAPTSYNGLSRQANVSVEPVPDTVDEKADRGIWDCAMQYGSFQGPQPTEESEVGTVRIFGDIGGGGTMTVRHSLDRETYGTEGEDPGLGDLIGVQEDGTVEGVEVETTVFNVTVTKVYSKYSIPNVDTMYALRGKVNSSDVTLHDTETGQNVHFDAGELLFRGAQFGNLRSDDGMEVSYQFAAIANVTGLSIDGISPIAKKGWYYMWAYYRQELTAQNRPVVKAHRVYVDQVYKEGNLNALGI